MLSAVEYFGRSTLVSKDTWQVLGWSALIVAGLLFAVVFWKPLLIALAMFLVLGTALAVVVGIPTFLISLCIEWSLQKAAQRTGKVVACCYALVAELASNVA